MCYIFRTRLLKSVLKQKQLCCLDHLWKKSQELYTSPCRIFWLRKWMRKQANSAIFRIARIFSTLLQIFLRFGPRRVTWHHNAHSAKTRFYSRASHMSTDKGSHLPTITTVKVMQFFQFKQLSALRTSQIASQSLKKAAGISSSFAHNNRKIKQTLKLYTDC